MAAQESVSKGSLRVPVPMEPFASCPGCGDTAFHACSQCSGAVISGACWPREAALSRPEVPRCRECLAWGLALCVWPTQCPAPTFLHRFSSSGPLSMALITPEPRTTELTPDTVPQSRPLPSNQPVDSASPGRSGRACIAGSGPCPSALAQWCFLLGLHCVLSPFTAE